MLSQSTGAIVNLIFDPIMIFGLFGFPKLGVAGAAYATVLGQVCAACVGLRMNLKKNPEIRISLQEILHPEASIVKRIYFVAIPSILMVSIGSLMTYMMNRILIMFSTTATAVFGVYFKLQSFIFMPVFGLNNGLIPVLAYNYGARRRNRIEEALWFTLRLAVGIMLAGMLVFQLMPDTLLRMFNASDEMLVIGRSALRIISISFPVAGACIVMGSVFQAFSQSYYSLIVSVGRQLVVLIPVAWLLSKTGVVTNVWWAFPIAEVMSLILSISLFHRLYKNIIMKI
jgi:putative MATE family efflux protein